MKKFLALLLALTMALLAGCGGNNSPAETTETVTAPPAEETTAATEPAETEPPVPETESASVLADHTAVMLTTANRGDLLDVVDEYNESYSVVKLEAGYGLVEKRLIRLDGAPAYEPWTGYALYGAQMYPDCRLRGEEPLDLGQNAQMTVLDSLGDVLVVRYGETIGYILAEQVSTYCIQPAPSGGGSGSGGADGGDISLGFRGGITLLGTFIAQTGDVSGTAEVLADGTPILLGWFDRNETVELVKEGGFAPEMEGCYTVYLEGLYGYVQQNLIAREGAEVYEVWTGYARCNAVMYDNYDLSGAPVQTLYPNEEIRVLCDLDTCYLVTVGEITGYVAREDVSEYFIVYSGGSNSGSESGSESGSGGDSGDWSPPVL